MRKLALFSSLLLFLILSSSSAVFADPSDWHINAGGADYTDGGGHLYVADKAYVSGDFGYGVAGRTFSFSSAIAGTDDDTLYQTIRSSYSFDYQFDLPAGDYDVTLHFMEPWQSAAGERLFDVTMEGATVLDDYDIYAAAGGQLTAVAETFTVNVSDGTLNIDFARVSRVAMVSAITVESAGVVTPEPEITVAPASLAYGDVENGTDSDMTISITNDGTADLAVSSLTSSDANFSIVSPTAPLTILPGNSEVVTVRFSPPSTGAYSGTLDIASDDADEPTVAVSLSGNGVEPPPNEPDISVSPASVDFGQITTGTSSDQIVTVSNDGTQLLTVSSMSSSNGVFTIESPAAPFDVAAGTSTDVTVRFSPAVDGAEAGDLTITSNDPDEGSVVVSLAGEGVSTPAAAYRINSGGADFTDGSGNLFVADKAYAAGDFGYDGNGRTFSFTDAIANTTDDILYQTVRSSFSFGYDFDVAAGDYDVTLYFMEPFQSAAGERLFDVTVEGAVVLDDYDIFVEAGGQFTAVSETFSVNVTDGTLNIDFDRVNRVGMVSAIEVTSAGSVTPAPEISVSPVSLAFGDVVTGETSDLTVTVSNVGTADLNVSSLTLTDAAFTIVSPTAPLVITPGNNEVVTMRFSPTALTAYSGDLDIASDDADEATVSVALSGTGVDTPPVDPDISLSTTSLAFGSVVVGNTSDQVVTVSNDGGSDLTVSDLATTNGLFTIVSPGTPFTVGAAASQDVTVRFTPTAAGAESGDLNITSDDPDEGVVTASLSGTGSVASGDTYSDVTSIVGMTTTVTQHGSICDKPPMGSGSAWGDYDNDGDVDVYMTNHGGANYLYRNDGDTTSDGLPDFTNVAASMGVENASDLSLSAVFIDYDNDGDQDLYVSNWDGNSLFENQLIESGSVSFVDVAAVAGVVDAGRTITSAWADFNEDGFLDFYVGKHRRCSGDDQSEDHLYESNGDGTFTDVTNDYLCGGASTCAAVTGLAFTPGWFDYDNDGDQDLYVVNDDIGGSYTPNVLWRNDGSDGSGGWNFTDVSTSSGLDVSLNGMGLGVGDFDNDGFFDVAFSNIAPGRLMHNDGDGTFSDVSGAAGVTAALTQGTWGTAFFDHDNDMDVDLYFVAGGVGSQVGDHRNVFMSNDGNGSTFTDVSVGSGLNNPGWGRSASMTDFDGDGWVDIVVGNYLDGYYLHHNDSGDQGNSNNWLVVTVEGTESNRDGIGTRLSLTAGGVTQIREINSGSTHGGGDYRAAFFGLGGNASGSLTIQWPNGVIESIGTVTAGQQLHEVEPSSTPPPTTTFVDEAGQMGMSLIHTTSATVCEGPPLGTGSAWADYDNDGDIDGFFVNNGAANFLYRNDGDTNSDGLPNYTDVAAAMGVDDPDGVAHSAVFIDYDNDGDQDLYVTNWNDGTAVHGNVLYENQLIESGSVSFTDVTATAGLADDGRAITSGWADYDQDGFLDVYLAKHTACGSDPIEFIQDHLYHNNGDGTFTDVSQYLCTSTGGVLPCPADIEGRGFMPGWFDMDNDGDQDLYLVNDWNASTNTNRLWRNDGSDGSGGWNFVEISGSADVSPAEVNGMGLSIGDPNNDGWLDLAFSDVGLAWLYLNDQDGTFTDVSSAAGVPAGVTWGTAFFDYDNDGWEDLFYGGGSIHDPVNNPEDVMLRNRGGEGFPAVFDDVSTATGLNHNGRARAVSMVDFDEDGFVDLVVGNYGQDYRVYRNYGAAQGNVNHWLTITVEGTESNRDGIGTRLILTTSAGTQIREISSGSEHGGGSYRAAYFGLDADISGSLEIQWPNGVVQTIGTVNADQALHYVEPSSTASTTPYVDVTLAAGVSGTHELGIVCEPPIGSGSAWADVDNDGDIDLFITNRGGANWLHRNDGDTNLDGVPDFTNIAASLGVDDAAGVSLGAVFIDYDNDGDQDLFVTNWDNDPVEGTYHGNILYENQLIETGSLAFTELTNAGLADDGRGITASWADLDGDGLLDVYIAKHKQCSATADPQDHLFKNNGDGTFTDVTSWLCAGLSTCEQVEGVGFSPGFFDYDNDGDLDLYLVNDIIGGDWYHNVMWRNDGSDGSGGMIFTDVSVAAGVDIGLNGMGLGIGDYDNDGFFDMAFSNIGQAAMMRNLGDGTFENASSDSGVGTNTFNTSWATVFFDHDNDGYLDLYFGMGNLHSEVEDTPNIFLINNGDATFSPYSTESGLDDMGRARSLSIADFDQDGWMDVFVGNYGGEFVLYQNRGPEQGNANHWLSITVEGTESNRDGIGTRLILTTADGTQMREISTGPTHGGGDQRVALFGLGSEGSATLTVQWPNGEVENLGTVTADQQLHLVEPASTE